VIINLNKPIGWTSFDVCKKVKKITKEKKVGHGGTLDPFASGVLVIGTGKDTKKLQYISDEKKSYDATIFLGEVTNTLDVDGRVIQKRKVPILDKKKITDVLDSFSGNYYQTPPMFSAKKVEGKKLYEYARKNIYVKRDPVMLKIFSISLNSFDEKNISFSVECSKGTYVRVLGKDISEMLGTIGYLNSLTRTKVGEYTLNKSQSIENLENSWKSSIQEKNKFQ
jgi:tRNA pseudouridine55 synthase